MKKPYFNREQRQAISDDTLLGSSLTFDLGVQKTLREAYRTGGWIGMKKMQRKIVRLINLKMFGRDSPKKWWQLF